MKSDSTVRLQTQKKQRNSNLELFRIITMLLIVADHYVANSGLLTEAAVLSAPLSLRSLFLLEFVTFGKTGINCFVLITGYFMCTSNITFRKFCKLLFEVMFYNFVFYFIFVVTGYIPFSWAQLLKLCIPVKSVADNFTGSFLVFFLSIPFLNILIHSLTEKQHIRLLGLSGFLYIVLGTVPSFSVKMNYVSWFIVLFFIGSYLRLYPKKIFENTKFFGCMALSGVLLEMISVVACVWLALKMGKQIGVQTPYRFVKDCNTFLAVFTGVSSFLFFNNLKMKYHPVINAVAGSTFGVLCIHANGSTMRQWLWKDFLHNAEMYSSRWMPLHAIGSVLGVFIVCTGIDLIRIRFIETPFFRWFDRIEPRIGSWFHDKEAKFFHKLNIQQ